MTHSQFQKASSVLLAIAVTTEEKLDDPLLFAIYVSMNKRRLANILHGYEIEDLKDIFGQLKLEQNGNPKRKV